MCICFYMCERDMFKCKSPNRAVSFDHRISQLEEENDQNLWPGKEVSERKRVKG